MTDHRHEHTERLQLDAVSPADLEELFALHADPEVWRHFPSGRHDSRERTAALIDRVGRDWATGRLGFWTVRVSAAIDDSLPAGTVIGVGGCSLRHDSMWNLYYRFTPAVWGHGFAAEMAAAARLAAADVHPELPVVAYLLEHNDGSKRTAERAGLVLAWRGPDSGNPDPDAVRLVYSDRPLASDVITAITTHA